ncbi:hypothetical protein EM20IM_06070 [Candidatus Methylacidiphilum infernorum]|uniref:Opacity protein or related surface antigen n=1 Tax=Candidatus Methylacidiphilum infernorum TaxID=511746 RepID=A0ABX7PSX8_9BACT|nr:hypothetical protein [Candidatus Methylacidiphilum infernorum]QSR86077.1 hypothetical protein EM20IM_06070 [Candidatus Methylacidiphilum infernorum]
MKPICDFRKTHVLGLRNSFLILVLFLGFWNFFVHAQAGIKDLSEIEAGKDLVLKEESLKQDWTKDLFLGVFSGGFWPSVSRTSSTTFYPSGREVYSQGYSQSHSGYFGGLYVGYDLKEAALALCADKKWKMIPFVACIFNYGQISSSGFSYNGLSPYPSFANASSQSFIPEIAAGVNFSNTTRFVPFVGITLGAALNWLTDPAVISPQGESLLAPNQTAFALAWTSKLFAGMAIRLAPHWDLLIAYTTRFISPQDFNLKGEMPGGVSSVVAHSGWYQDFEGWGAIQYNFWP